MQAEPDGAGRGRGLQNRSISSASAGVQSITMRSMSSNLRKSEFSTSSLMYLYRPKRPTLMLKRMMR